MHDLRCTNVVFTAHSLGAAIATLASMDLRGPNTIHVDAVWTYGSPRVGNAEFVKAYVAAAERQSVDPPSWRIVHYHDIIPRINLHSAPWGPRHVPLEVYYYTENPTGPHKECPPENNDTASENRRCSFGTPVTSWDQTLELHDHMRYLGISFGNSTGFDHRLYHGHEYCGFKLGSLEVKAGVFASHYPQVSMAVCLAVSLVLLCCFCCVRSVRRKHGVREFCCCRHSNGELAEPFLIQTSAYRQ